MVENPQLPVVVRVELSEADDVQDNGEQVQKHVYPDEQKAFEMVVVEGDVGLPLHIELTQKYQHQNGLENPTGAVILFVPSDGSEYLRINLEVPHRAQPSLIIGAIPLCDSQVFGLQFRDTVSLFGVGDVQITDVLPVFSNVVKIQMVVPSGKLILGVVVFTSGLKVRRSKL